VGVLNIFFSVEAQHSYLSKVFKEQEAPVLVVHWNKELPGERIRVQLNQSLRRPDIRFYLFLESKNVIAIIGRNLSEEAKQEIQHQILTFNPEAEFRMLTLVELDKWVDQEVFEYRGGKGILPDFFSTHYKESETGILLVRLRNIDRDYPILKRVLPSYATAATYSNIKQAHVILINGKERVPEVQAILQQALEPLLLDTSVKNLYELNLLIEGLY
ncbi:MAG: hypothetical protein RML72_02165, partial [Bacteroidia bacterium]|nr:hypothetical protein [Bacteroidia bacterium]